MTNKRFIEMYPASDIAKYTIGYEASRGRRVNNLRLQKLLYFIQVKVLTTLSCPCFYDDIEAWDFGPVVPTVYRGYKVFGGASIPCLDQLEAVTIDNPEMRDAINAILDECARYTTSRLVEITQGQEPWESAYRRFDNRITTKSIQQYFVARKETKDGLTETEGGLNDRRRV